MDSGPDGFTLFVSGQGTALLRTAVLLSGGDLHHGEDLLQASLLKVYRHWRRASANPAAYTRQVMARGATDRWRSHQRRPIEVQDKLPDRASSESAFAEQLAENAWAGELLADLPRGQRAVLVLRYYEDLTERETADLLGISIGTVKSQTARALQRLRETTSKQASVSMGGDHSG